MKYQITYETKGGNGYTTVEETEVDKMKATLENSGCFNIVVEPIREYDRCDYCNRPMCHGCPYQEE